MPVVSSYHLVRSFGARRARPDLNGGSQDGVDDCPTAPSGDAPDTAAGWGGLPTSEAVNVGVGAGLPVGRYELRVPADVPVDAFWSISVYNADGFLEPNSSGRYSINSITAARDPDGSITLDSDHGPDAPNSIPITEGWNYTVRLYRPRPEILNGSWKFPEIAR
jgi:hypothetical protein